MLMQKEREAIAFYGNKMVEDKLTFGTGGNISIIDRAKGFVAIKPSGMEYSEIKAEDVVVVDLDRNIIEGSRKPSSELALHLAFYEKKKFVNSVVHCHSIFAITYAVLKRPLKAVHYIIGDAETSVIPCAPYTTFGTDELANITIDACKDSKAVLMANHGQTTCGRNIKEAYGLALNVEKIAEISYRAECIGKPNILTEKQMEDALIRFNTYGQK